MIVKCIHAVFETISLAHTQHAYILHYTLKIEATTKTKKRKKKIDLPF